MTNRIGKAQIGTAQTGQMDLPLGSGVTLFGVGGAGGNAVARLFRDRPAGMKIVCANTDMQALRAAPSKSQLQLGRRLTGGFGAGAKPDVGRAAAEESLPDIAAALAGVSVCFIAAGLGGGTGTGAAPVIAKAARDRGILTIAIVTKPFSFEGARRGRVADAGAAELEQHVDALVVVCNEHLFRVAGPDTTFRQALDLSDSIVRESATDFAALIAGQALKRVGVADMRSILNASGRTVIGHGERCAGSGRAALAAASALRNPLLEDAAQGASRLLVTIAGGSDLGLFEVEEAVEYLREHVHPGAHLAWGAVIDPALEGRMRVGITATGLPIQGAQAARAVPLSAVAAAPVAAKPASALVQSAAARVVPAVQADETEHRDIMPVFDTAPSRVPGADAADGDHGAPLILTSSYSLDLDIVADRPLSKRIRSRAAAGLFDRLYFAARELKRGRRGAPVPMMPPRQREMRIIAPALFASKPIAAATSVA